MTPKQIHKARSSYYGDVSFIDTQVGRLLNWMGKYNPQDYANTWFIFLSDHGDMLGDHNLWRKTYAYEGSARIQMMIKPPGRNTVRRHLADEPVELRDIMPTVLQIAGVHRPDTVDGKSLLPLLDAPADDWREYVHGEHCWCYSHEQEMQYVTDGREKFIWLPRTGIQQFFDLVDDPGETQNLIDVAACADHIELWRDRLINELRARDCGWCTDGKLSCPDEPLVSPYQKERWTGNRKK